MELFIVEMARYVIILLFALYTFYSFRAFAGHNNKGRTVSLLRSEP